MKSLRAMLLVALTLVAPVAFAEEEVKKDDAKSGMLSKAWDLATFPFAFFLATMPDTIAENTLGRIAKMEYLKDGKIAAFLGHKYTGRVAVFTVTAYALWKLNQMYQKAQDDVTDEDTEIFTSDN